MNSHTSLSSNWMSSKKWYLQILGALISSKTKIIALPLALMSIALLIAAAFNYFPELLRTIGGMEYPHYLLGKVCGSEHLPLLKQLILFAAATLIVIIVWHVVRTLTPIYCLLKAESRITYSQIALLASFGIWLICTVMIFNIGSGSNDNPSHSVIIAIIGAVLSWIFADTIKSVVAFFYLRANNLLKIGDWIQAPSHGIDGVVKQITLTTVTLENWDTTKSSFPTYILHSGHFKNNQDMLDGKTYGRRMMKTFIIDTGWIHTMSDEDINKLKGISNLDAEKKEFLNWFLSNQTTKASVLNIELYRQYVYHWLMHHPHISHEPRLVVRWLEQVPEGLPLQVYAFITDSSLAPYEWQQSQIIEHIIEALAWFHLQLYQSASGYDASNCNVNMMETEANYRRKIKDNGEIQ